MAETNYDAAEEFYEEYGDPNVLKMIWMRHKNAYRDYLSNIYSTSNFKGGLLQPSPFELIVSGLKQFAVGVYNLFLTLLTMLVGPLLASGACFVEGYRNKKHLEKYVEKQDL